METLDTVCTRVCISARVCVWDGEFHMAVTWQRLAPKFPEHKRFSVGGRLDARRASACRYVFVRRCHNFTYIMARMWGPGSIRHISRSVTERVWVLLNRLCLTVVRRPGQVCSAHG